MKIMLVIEMDKAEALARVDNDFGDIDPADKQAVHDALLSVVRDYGTVVYQGREEGVSDA